MKRVPLLCTVLFSAVAVAQDKVDLRIQEGTKPLRYTIESNSKTKSETARTVDGQPQQPQQGGGRGAPTGPVNMARSQRVVFDEGKADDGTWRQYVSATAKIERPDDTGGVDKQEIAGGLVGHRLTLVEDDRGVVVKPDSEDLPRFATIGVPGHMSFAGITPKEGVAVGSEFELGASFLHSLKSLSHPVNPAMAGGQARGADGAQPGGGRGGRGQGQGAEGQPPAGGDPQAPPGGQRRPRGQGGDNQNPQGGQGAQGGRGQRGAFGPGGRGAGGMFGMGGVDSTALLANDKLEGKLTAKLVAVDGNIAKLQLSGKRAGEGSIEELGLLAARGGRGGQGGQGGQRGGGNFPTPEGDAAAEVTLAGEMWIDISAHQLVKLVIEGKSKQHTNLEMDMGDRGVMGIESTGEEAYRYAVQVENAPAKEEKAKEDKK